jgi:hypothetical protein
MGLVESLLEDLHVEGLSEPLLGILSHLVHDDIIELLELLVKRHSLFIIGVEGKVERVGCTTSAFISEGTHTVRRAHERELDVELFVVAGIQVDGLAAILVLAKFRKLHSGRENSVDCWIVSDIVGSGLYIS